MVRKHVYEVNKKSVDLFLSNVSVMSAWYFNIWKRWSWCDDARMLNYRKPRNEDSYNEMME